MVSHRPTKSQKSTGSGNGHVAKAGGAASATAARATPDVVPDPGPLSSPGGSYKIEDVIVGCKIFVEKPDAATGEVEQRKAEILSVREKQKPRLSRRERLDLEEAAAAAKKDGKATADAEADPSAYAGAERFEYYVHYCEFNKRLDEWVNGKRLILSKDLEWPRKDGGGGGHGHGHGASSSASAASQQKKKKENRSGGGSGSSTPSTPLSKKSGLSEAGNLLKKAAAQAASQAQQQQAKAASSTGTPGADDSKIGSDIGGDDASSSQGGGSASADPDAMAIDGGGAIGEGGAVVAIEVVDTGEGEVLDDIPTDAAVEGLTESLHPNKRPEVFSKEQEIEKLRTSGSMTQSVHEIARVKNLNKIQMGKHEVETWYFSPYPLEFAHIDTLYICEMCLSYYPSSFVLARHRKKCSLLHPPGNEIYRHEDISFFEIDGKKQKTWCRNLCLLSKCFLDHKTLYYDVDPFMYDIMCKRDDVGVHTIGYFSKEKESAEGYNVACILTLPQHQRMGYGKLLIEFSYELSKREQKLGSPEKPLSDLGLLSYRAYWAETIVEMLLATDEDASVDDIANRTAIVHADVLHTCTALNMLKQYQGKHYLVLSDGVIAQHERQMKKRRSRIHSEALNWKPPVFTRDQLRFGW